MVTGTPAIGGPTVDADPEGIRGRVAVVTGGARGIGAAVARLLHERGALVAVLDRDRPDLSRHDSAAPARHDCAAPTLSGYPVDVTDPAAVDAVVATVERELGPIGICVNVAGVLRTAPVVSTSDDDWSSTFAVNSSGVFHVCRAVARVMLPRRHGVIVTVASNAAGVPRTGMAAYAASKAAAVMFTKCLGLELAPHGIRCNVVAPGSTDTDMQRALWRDGNGPEQVIAGTPEAWRVGIPLGRIADPVDVAEAVVFLASDRARHITMHDLYVDGGATLRA